MYNGPCRGCGPRRYCCPSCPHWLPPDFGTHQQAPVLQNSWMTVATSEDRINTHKTLQPPSHTRDLGGQRDLLTAHGNLFHGSHAALGHDDQSAGLGQGAEHSGHCIRASQAAQNACRQKGHILGLRRIGEGHWDRGVGTEVAGVRALAPEAGCLACGDSAPTVMVWDSTDVARPLCHPEACQPDHEI